MTDQRQTLYGLLKAQRGKLLERWGNEVAGLLRAQPLSKAELLDHIPVFVDELTAALFPDVVPLPGGSAVAEEHGAQRLRLGFDVGEVVREYGVLHMCILQLAADADVPITVTEHSVITRWINAGVAQAVSQYVSQRDVEIQRQASEHLGFIAHEIRNPLSAAKLLFQRLRMRELASGGRMVELVERNLKRTGDVIDSVLTHASFKMGIAIHLEHIRLRQFLTDIAQDAGGEAQNKRVDIQLAIPDEVVLDADPRLLRSAVANLVLNAVKFSHADGEVALAAYESDGRVLIEVSDSCGGLPPGKAEELFSPLVQRGEDRSGFGLGLAIAMQAAEAHNGTIKVRDVPGRGCVFILDLPGHLKSA